MTADLKLKTRQALWETPKGLAAIIAALAVTIGAIGGILGYTLRSVPPPQPMFPPGTVITIPPAR